MGVNLDKIVDQTKPYRIETFGPISKDMPPLFCDVCDLLLMINDPLTELITSRLGLILYLCPKCKNKFCHDTDSLFCAIHK